MVLMKHILLGREKNYELIPGNKSVWKKVNLNNN